MYSYCDINERRIFHNGGLNWHIEGLPKDDRVASFGFLKRPLRRYGSSKNLCTDGITRLSVLATGLFQAKQEIKLREYLTESWLITKTLFLSQLSIVL